MEKPKKKTDTKADKEFVKNTIELNPKLQEAASKTVVFSWGRMNPVTVGHEKLVNKVKSIAKSQGAVPLVFLSHSQDAKKNPLSYEDKYMIARSAFGATIQKSNAKTIMHVMQELQKKFTDVILVVGADRIKEFETLLNKYNGKDFNMNSIKVVSAGDRDPDAEGVEGMSASKMRAAAASGDEAAFKSGLPKKIQKIGKEVYDMVRSGMKIAEELEREDLLNEAVLNIAQRRKRGLIMRKYKTKIAAARNRAKRKMAGTEQLTLRARKAAIKLIRKKVAGSKGMDYANLSPAEKIMIDKRVSKKQSAIERIARRLMPKVRKAEAERLRSRNSTKNEAFENMFESTNNTPTKRFHELYRKDKTVKTDQRFKMYKKKNEDVDLINMIESLSDDIYQSVSLDESKIKNALFEKSMKSGISISEITEAYNVGVDAWCEESSFDTPAQQGFARVSVVVAEKKMRDEDDQDGMAFEGKKSGLWDNIHNKRKRIASGSGEKMRKPGSEGAPTNQDFKDASESVSPEEKMYTHAYNALMHVLKRKKADNNKTKTYEPKKTSKHDLEYYASQIARGYRDMDARKLRNMIPSDFVFEEYGAGEDGTSKLSKKYKKDTPCQDVNESFENMLNEETQCALVTKEDIRELEKFADNLLKTFDIDVEFTRHFGDRMSDDRNSPCINVKELKDFFRKIYANKGIKIKGNRGIEAILKDIQKSLNMPVVIDYKNNEVELTFKTIMRKKNFTSPNRVIAY